MSTRCNVHFLARGELEANIYKHWDGYPEHMLGFIDAFFAAVLTESPHDTRFDDPSYLAARFVVYAAMVMGRGLSFTGVGVTMQDAGDGEYLYEIECSSHAAAPLVRWRSVREEGWRTGHPADKV